MRRLSQMLARKSRSEPMPDKRLDELKQYIVRHETHLDRYMRPMFDPAGKKVLVLGCGWGTETYWAFKNGAASVYGIDPAPRPTLPIETALGELSRGFVEKFEHKQGFIWDVPEDEGPFDAIISNNVFEHVFNLTANLTACRKLIPQKGGRLHIFTDPLFLSSAGSHLPIAPWEHLTETQQALKARPETATNWEAYRDTLNGMTITSFLEAVREAGMWVERLTVVPDRNRAKFAELAEKLPPSLKPLDLLLEGLSCTLAFPENI